MNERRFKSKLLVHYLNLAEQGDKEAEKLAAAIGSSMKDVRERTGGRVQPVKVTHPDGREEYFISRKEVSAEYGISRNTLSMLIANGIKHSSGLRFENAERTEPNE